MKHIVKRAGHIEPFDSRKIYASVFAACLAVRVTQPEAEIISDNVTKAIEEWIKDKPTITSHQIGRETARILTYYHPDAAYLYEHQRDIS